MSAMLAQGLGVQGRSSPRGEGLGGRGWWPRGWHGAALSMAPSAAARLIQHTKDLMESEEKLCVKVLRTLQQMLLKKTKYGDRVSTWGAGCRACLATAGQGQDRRAGR